MGRRALVIGGSGYIGRALVWLLNESGWMVYAPSRDALDLLAIPEDPKSWWAPWDVVYLCAAITRFIECEDQRIAYRVNVDAPIRIAQLCDPKKVVYLSSE